MCIERTFDNALKYCYISLQNKKNHNSVSSISIIQNSILKYVCFVFLSLKMSTPG